MKILMFVILFCATSFGQTAFPTAVGFGKNATGGRGGDIKFVTNLNNSGAGSLRAALEASGARTVVFRVGGTITLNSPIWIENGDLTIAGETAPGDGILIKGNKVEVNRSNVIIRGLRFRLGTPTSGTDVDAFSITSNQGGILQNAIIDHCSFSWADDENFNIRGSNPSNDIARNITVQNCIISECGYGVLLYQNVQNVSFYQNLLAFNAERNIRANYGYEDVFKFEMVNNLIYAWNYGATNPSNGQKYTVINNKYKISTSFSPSENEAVVGASPADTGVPDGWTYAYISGNIIPSGFNQYNSRVSPYIKSTPYATSGLTDIAYQASEIEEKILGTVGDSFQNRDAVDTRIVNSYNSGTGNIASSGTFPTISSGTPYADSDNDGMADDWEMDRWGNLDQSNNGDDDDDGYTNLEEFLHYMAGDIEEVAPPDPDPEPTPSGKGKGINRNIFLTLE